MDLERVPILITPFNLSTAGYNEGLDQILNRLYEMKKNLSRDAYTYFNGRMLTTEKTKEENIQNYEISEKHECIETTDNFNEAKAVVSNRISLPGYVEVRYNSDTIEGQKLNITYVDSRFLEYVPTDEEDKFLDERIKTSMAYGSKFFYDKISKAQTDTDHSDDDIDL